MIKEAEILEYLRIKQMLDFGLHELCFNYFISLNKKLKNHTFVKKSECWEIAQQLASMTLQKNDIEVTKTSIKCQICDRSDLSDDFPVEIYLGVLYIPLGVLWEDVEIVANREYQKLIFKNADFEYTLEENKKLKEEKEQAEFEKLWSKLELA